MRITFKSIKQQSNKLIFNKFAQFRLGGFRLFKIWRILIGQCC